MIKFDKPINLNGLQLRQELKDAGVLITDEPNALFIDGNDNFWLAIDKKDESKAKSIVDAHIGLDNFVAESQAKAQAKADLLVKLGITEDEAKLLLS